MASLTDDPAGRESDPECEATGSSVAWDEGLSAAAAEQAARVIAEWREYLPPDCVAAMIRDGWHRS